MSRSNRTGTKHDWRMDPGVEVVFVCTTCGLYRCEHWPNPDSLQPEVEYSTSSGTVVARGRPSNTQVPRCAPAIWLDDSCA